VLGSIRAALGDIWDVPLRPFQAAAADLPAAADFAGGLAWNLSSLRVTWSDGTSWQEAQPYDADLAAIAALSATGLAARTGAGAFALRSIAGTANQISVANGGGVLGDPTISLPAAITAPGSLTVTTNLACNGNATLGDATSDAHAVNGGVTHNVAAGGAAYDFTDGTRTLRLTPTAGGAVVIVGTTSAHDLNFMRGGNIGATLTASAFNLASGWVYQVNAAQVVGVRKSGWSTATGTATRTSFDTGTVTLSQLAERVKALIDDLHASAGHGLIGS
jgi:hypothetical protein